MNNDQIFVLGIEFTKTRFPNLYRKAQRNPEGLAEYLKALAKQGGGNLQSVAITLEHDLEHERRAG